MASTRVRRTRLDCGSLLVLAGLSLAACELPPERAIVTRVEALKPLAPPVAAAGAVLSERALLEHALLEDEVPARPPITACSDVERKASELAEGLPRDLDADTRATRVTATGCDLRLEYELLTLAAQQVSERGLRAMRRQVLDRLCVDKGALAVMQRGGRFTNVYFDREQAPIGLFTVAADDCGI